MPALAVNIIIVHPRENNTPRMNNYDVHLKALIVYCIIGVGMAGGGGN